jgi:hypothetical protein
MPKPGDFFVGVVDLFGIVIPGAIVIYLLEHIIPATAYQTWKLGTSVENWIVTVLLAYLAGSYVLVLTQRTFGPLYHWAWSANSRWWWPDYFARKARLMDEYKAYVSARVRLEIASPPGVLAISDLVQQDSDGWATRFVRTKVPQAVTEIDRYRADERLFRSLTLVFVVALVVAVASVVTHRGAEGWVIPLLVALILLSAYLFVQRRYTRELTTYQYFMALHATGPSSAEPGAPL